VNISKKIIVVCGDLVWDTHIARLPSDPRGYFQPHLQSQLINRHGGAWYLHDVIVQALIAERVEGEVLAPARVAHVDIEERKGDSGVVAKGFSVWEWFDGRQKPAQAKVGEGGKVEYKWSEGEACPGA